MPKLIQQEYSICTQYLTLRQTAKMTGLNKTKIWKLLSRNRFPPMTGHVLYMWRRSDVKRWMMQRQIS